MLALTAPTEAATAAAFAHTAVLGGRPGNANALAEAGRLFGRLAHLLDAVDDLDDDRAAGRFNPIDVTGTPGDVVRAHCDDAVLGIRLALQEATFADRRVVHRLLVHETRHAVDRAFAAPVPGPAVPVAPDGDSPTPRPRPPAPPLPGPPHRILDGCVTAIGLCCTGQVCCASEFEGPRSHRRREGCLRKGDCCDCCDPCECGCECCCDSFDCSC